MPFKYIISGPKTYTNIQKVFDVLDKINRPDVIITGGNAGVESAAQSWAGLHDIPVEIYKADIDLMASHATHCIIIRKWNTEGRKKVINAAKKYNLNLELIIVD